MFSLGLGFFELTLLMSELEGRFDENELSFRPVIESVGPPWQCDNPVSWVRSNSNSEELLDRTRGEFVT